VITFVTAFSLAAFSSASFFSAALRFQSVRSLRMSSYLPLTFFN
jgi:hypothetical protein